MSTKAPVFLFTNCSYSYSCKYIVKVKKMNRWFQINVSNGLGCNVIGWVIDKIFVVKNHIFGNTIANWQWKTECFFLSALLRFFLKTMYDSYCKKNWGAKYLRAISVLQLGLWFNFFVSYFERVLVERHVREREKKNNNLDNF